MSDTISSALSAGTISSTDATALTGALSTIDSSLSSDRAGSASASTTTRAKLDPSSMKDRIDGLIADQVSSGSLTADQATELKNLFSSHGQSVQSADATGDVSGQDGPPPGPPPGESASGSTGSGTSSSTSVTQATTDLLSTFIQQLQGSQSGSASYGAGGTTNGGTISALLVDFRS
ncbi:hypothetical protein [Methylobacterium sp. P5_C11]